MSLGFISLSSSAVFWDKSEVIQIPAYPFPEILPFLLLPAADKLSAPLRLRPKLASAFNNSGGRLVQLQLHKLVNYGMANSMN